MNDALWTFDRVSLGTPPSRRLEQVSLEVLPGVTAVVGYSGAGKTSLLNLLVGYERPGSGKIQSPGIGTSDDPHRLSVFWGPQDDGLWPHVTVRGHLDLVLPASHDGVATELLDAFDLTALAAATPASLSRGEASRLAVARAIASDAAVLVLDEPLEHVDPARRDRYWDRLLQQTSSRGSSLVFASHSPADVLRFAGRVVGLQDGRVLFHGETRSLYESPLDEAAALLLGPVNWLPRDERTLWKVAATRDSACVRPERLAVEPGDDGVAVVVASRSGGPVAETQLRHADTDDVRRFCHRPSRERLRPGMRVRLAVLALLAMFSLAGCMPAAGGPPLEVASERSFALPADGVLIPQPRDIAIGLDGEKVVLDNAGRVLVYDAEGQIDRQWEMPESTVGNPEGACVLPDGRIVVADTHYHRVVIFDSQGNVVEMFGELGREPGQFIYPVAVATDNDGHLYVAEYGGNDRVQKFDRDRKVLATFGSFGTATGQFQRPSGMIWLDGKIYVVDAFNNRGLIFSDAGKYLGMLGTAELGLHYPYDMSLGPDGRFYIIEYGAGRLTVLTPEGTLIARYGMTGTSHGQFQTPWGLAVDDAGRIWVADTGNRRVVELVPEAEGLQSLGLVDPPLLWGEGGNCERRHASHDAVAASHALRGIEPLAGFAGVAP